MTSHKQTGGALLLLLLLLLYVIIRTPSGSMDKHVCVYVYIFTTETVCRRSRRYDLDITFRERIGHDLAYLSSFSQSSVVIYDTGNRARVLSPVSLPWKKT